MTPLIDTPTILIIDDTPSNLSVVVSLFESKGYRVAIAQDGDEGLQRARLVQPDLILLDVMMPGMDGFQACERLKTEPLTHDIPVIFMTALATTEHKVKGFDSGAVDYVTKPLQIDEVMARVETHLKLHAAQKRLAEQNEELEQRVAERTEALAERERRFRTLAENLPDNLARYDKHCRLVYMNQRLETILGKKLEDVQGRTPLETSVGEFYVPYQQRLAETIATGKPGEVELVLPDNGDGIHYHHIRFVAERDAAGEIVGALAIGRDITERKQAERELQLLSQAVNNSSEAVFLQNETGRFVYVNEEACRSLDYSREELLTMSPVDIDPEITPEILQGLLDSIFNFGPSKAPMESVHRARDGRTFPIEIAASPIRLEGERYVLTMVRDISERKQAEAKLYEREQALSAVVENSPDTIIRYDRELRRIYLNPAMEEIFGKPREQLLNTSPLGATPMPESYLHALREVLRTGREQHLETPFRDAQGRARWVDLRMAPEFGADGEVLTVLAIGRDITERKRADRELHLLNHALDNAFDATYLIDEDMRLRYVNEAAVRALGYSREELLGMTLPDIDPNLKPEMLKSMMKQTSAMGRFPGILETQHRRKDGSVFPIEIGATVFQYEGECLHLTTVRDITERKQAERLLYEQGQAIRAAVDHSPDAYARYDRQLRRVYINPATQTLYGIPTEEIIGKTIDELPAAPDDFAEVLNSVFESGEELRIELPFRWPNGERGWGDVRIVPEYDPEGNIVTVLSIGRDITERRRAEDLLREERGLFVGGPTVVFKWQAQDGWPVEYVSPNVLEQFGYAAHELTSGTIPFSTIVHPGDLGRVAAEVATFTAQGRTSYEQEYRIVHADGSYRWIYDFTIVSRNEDGGVNHYLGYVMDVTDRKNAEHALKESEQRYRLVFENSPISIWEEDFSGVKQYFDTLRAQGVSDIDVYFESNPQAISHCAELARIVDVNQAAVELHAAENKEALFDGLFNTFTPESFEAFRQELSGLWKGKMRMAVDAMVKTHPGELRHVTVHFSVCPGYEDSFAKVLVSIVDITERKQAELALAIREREFRTLAENIPDNIVRYDRNGRKVYLNTATANLMGVRPEEVLNQTPQETPEDKRAMKIDKFSECLQRVLQTGEPQEIEMVLRHVEQGMQVHNVRFVAERDERGEIVGALMVGHDITALKNIENELKEREQRYREIFDNAVEGMYLLEVTEDGRFRNIEINPALAASTGIPREAMIGRFVDETVPEEAGRAIVEKYRRVVAAGKTLAEVIELELPTGKRTYYSTITPIYLGDKVHRLIGISRDITDLKRVEHELKDSRQQLRGLTARREQVREEERKYIAREVHDELGQILTGLKLNVSLLGHKFASESAALREHLKETAQLTDRSLEVARNVASALRPAALDMGISSALEWLAGRFESNTGIRCSTHVDDGNYDLSEDSAIALFRIAQESLTNVARHAQASHIEIELCIGQDDYTLKVRDNGRGFDTAHKKMDSFGVVGMRERATMLGGEFVVESQPGKGTLVMVRIPHQKHQGEI